MAYIVKYIDNCARNGADIYPLFRRDLQMGDKVILVCSREFAPLYTGDDVVPVNSVEEIKKSSPQKSRF